MKNFFLFSLLLLSLAIVCQTGNAEGKKPFSLWPSLEKKIKGVKILIADTEQLAHQGFCNASPHEFENIAIWFPDIGSGTVFVNENPGYGKVEHDLIIVFLDKNWNVIDMVKMERNSGVAVAPSNTCSAIEAIPEIAIKLGFKKGEASPFRIEKEKNRYIFIWNKR